MGAAFDYHLTSSSPAQRLGRELPWLRRLAAIPRWLGRKRLPRGPQRPTNTLRLHHHFPVNGLGIIITGLSRCKIICLVHSFPSGNFHHGPIGSGASGTSQNMAPAALAQARRWRPRSPALGPGRRALIRLRPPRIFNRPSGRKAMGGLCVEFGGWIVNRQNAVPVMFRSQISPVRNRQGRNRDGLAFCSWVKPEPRRFSILDYTRELGFLELLTQRRVLSSGFTTEPGTPPIQTQARSFADIHFGGGPWTQLSLRPAASLRYDLAVLPALGKDTRALAGLYNWIQHRSADECDPQRVRNATIASWIYA